MPRDNIYYRDWTATDGTRYRLEILPANTYTPQAGTPVSLPAVTGVPNWGSAPGGGSIYIKLGDEVVTTTAVGDAAYDGLPLGLPIPPTLKVGINLTTLNRDGHSDLVDYLLNPTVTDAGQNLYAGTVFSYQLYDLSNTFTLFSDTSGTGTVMSSFHVEFMGCQQSPITTMLEIFKNDERAILNVECIHVARVAMESVPISLVAALAISNYTGGSTFGPTGILYEYIYADATFRYGRAHAKYKSDDDEHFDNVYLYKIKDLQNACQSLMNDVFRATQRIHPTATGSAGFYCNNVNDPSYDITLKNATPLDVFKFYRQGYTVNNAFGSSLLNGDNGNTDMGNLLWFPGLVWHSNITTPTAATAEANCFTGFLHSGGGDESIFEFPTLYDFQMKWALGSFCKGQYVLSDRETLKVYYNTVNSRMTSLYQIIPSLVLKDGSGGKEADIEIGAEAITGTNISWKGGGDLDIADWVFKGRGVKSDQENSLEMVFSNAPTAGSAANRFQMSGDSSDPGYNPDISGPFVIGASTSTPLRTLFYTDTPSFSGGPIAIKVHDRAVVYTDHVGSNLSVGEQASLPTDPSSVFDIAADFDGKFWNNMIAHIKRSQTKSGIPVEIANAMNATFGSRRQTKYTVSLPLVVGGLDTLGEKYELSSYTGSGDVGGNAFLGAGTYLGTLPGNPFVTSVTPDYATGISKVTLLAPSS
jgi:hypothetical protein